MVFNLAMTVSGPLNCIPIRVMRVSILPHTMMRYRFHLIATKLILSDRNGFIKDKQMRCYFSCLPLLPRSPNGDADNATFIEILSSRRTGCDPFEERVSLLSGLAAEFRGAPCAS